jgi:hypothetical protein
MHTFITYQAYIKRISSEYQANINARQNEKRDQILQSDPDILVRLAGIEPTTPWFVAKYSIQLSYSRLSNIVTRLFRFGNFDFSTVQLNITPFNCFPD